MKRRQATQEVERTLKLVVLLFCILSGAAGMLLGAVASNDSQAGGIGTLLGPVVGAATFTVLDELLRPLGQLRLTLYGVVLVALFLGFRRGLVPAVTGLACRLSGRRRSATREAPG
jgi:hypothetical protein